MRFSDLTVKEFVSELASKAPVPGGGGASALVGALGVALGDMVGALTVGKKKYQAVEAEILACREQAARLEARLLSLIDEDAEAFRPLSQAYGIKAETEAEKAEKVRVLDQAMVTASGVPLAIMETIGESLDLFETFLEKGTVIAVSDVGCGAQLCRAAVQAASLNVRINTMGMKDRSLAQPLDRRCDELLENLVPRFDRLFEEVAARFAVKEE